MSSIDNVQTSRRSALGGALGMGLLAGFPMVGLSKAEAAAVRSAQPSPDEAFEMLMAGNRRFIDGSTRPDDYTSTRERLVDGQAPFAIILRCADSRVSPEIVFDQGLGDLFVCAVAGNVPTSDLVASMEFSVAVLGSPLIVVMGHSGCGAVDAAIDNLNSINDLPGSLPGLISEILPAVIQTKSKPGNALANATAENVRIGVNRLPKMSSIIKDAKASGDLKIVGGVYEMSTGSFDRV